MALLQKAYLGATPLFRNEDWFESGARLIVSIGSSSSVTADTVAHVKGGWQEIIASTAADSSLLSISVGNIGAASTNTSTLLDIGIGAGGSETSIISDVAVGGATGNAAGTTLNFEVPFKIASGTRISARIQSLVTGGKTAYVEIAAVDAGDYATAPTSVTTIGTDTATSTGTLMSGSSGTWVEIIASTAAAYRAVVMVPSLSSANLGGNANTTYTVGVGSPEVAIGSARFRTNTAEQIYTLNPTSASVFGRALQASSRLAVKHTIGSTPSDFAVTLIGIP